MSKRSFHFFPTTRWTLVARAGNRDSAVRREALSELVKTYHEPLRVHLIWRCGIDPHEAEDLLQAFLVSRVLEQELICQADPGKGRFRDFLLRAMERFVANAHRPTARKKFAGAMKSLEQHLPQMVSSPTHPDSYDTAWARRVLEITLERMFKECEKNGRQDVWIVFEGRVIAETMENAAPVEYEELAARLGMESKAQAANLLVTGKRMFARTLRSVVGEYEPRDREIDDEIRALSSLLSRG